MKTISEKSYRDFIAWLINQRKSKNISQDELATRLGLVSNSYISKIEKSERRLDVQEFVKICRVLEISYVEGMKILEQAQTNFIK